MNRVGARLAFAAVGFAAAGFWLLTGQSERDGSSFGISAGSAGSSAAASVPTLGSSTASRAVVARASGSPGVAPHATESSRTAQSVASPSAPAGAGGRGDVTVEEAASAFMKAFARPTSAGSAQWWERVRPLLSVQARQDFLGADPTQVPFTRITGSASRVELEDAEGSQGLVVLVAVPTDAGLYVVHLVPGPRGWLVSRVTAPARPDMQAP